MTIKSEPHPNGNEYKRLVDDLRSVIYYVGTIGGINKLK